LQVETLLRAKEEELHRWEASLKRELSVPDTDQQTQPQPQPPQPQPPQRTFTAAPQPTHSFQVNLSSQGSAGSYAMLAPPPGHPGTRHAAAQPGHHPHIDYGESVCPVSAFLWRAGATHKCFCGQLGLIVRKVRMGYQSTVVQSTIMCPIGV
jgi:hypothetical protein